VTTRGAQLSCPVFGLADSDGNGVAGPVACTMPGLEADCSVCLTDPKNTVLLPCRHLCVCQTCMRHLDKCPVCRAPFSSYAVFERPDGSPPNAACSGENDEGGGGVASSPLHGHREAASPAPVLVSSASHSAQREAREDWEGEIGPGNDVL